MILRTLIVAVLALAAAPVHAQTQWPNQRETDFLIKDFHFTSGETLGGVKNIAALGIDIPPPQCRMVRGHEQPVEVYRLV